jgi:hypothetical protein
VDAGFIIHNHLRKEGLTACMMLAQNISGDLCPCLLCVSLNIHGTQSAHILKYPSTSVMVIVLPLPVSSLGQCISSSQHMLSGISQCKTTTWQVFVELTSVSASVTSLT